MKNVILTHNELQINMFSAFAGAMCKTYKVPEGYFLTWSHTDHSFVFELWKSASSPESRDGKRILIYDEMNRGCSELNDIRLGVMVNYWQPHAQKFLNQVENWFRTPENCSQQGSITDQYSPIEEKLIKSKDASLILGVDEIRELLTLLRINEKLYEK